MSTIATRLTEYLARLEREEAARRRSERASRPRRTQRRRSTSIALRLEPSVAELWRLAAADEGLTLTDWLERAARARLHLSAIERAESGRRSTPQTEAQMVAALKASLAALPPRD